MVKEDSQKRGSKSEGKMYSAVCHPWAMVHWSAKPRRERPSDEWEKLSTHSIHTRQFRRWRHARDCCPELSNSLRPHCRCTKLCRSFGALVDGTMVPVGQLGLPRERSAVLPEDTCGVESKSNPRAKCLLQRTRLSRCEGLGLLVVSLVLLCLLFFWFCVIFWETKGIQVCYTRDACVCVHVCAHARTEGNITTGLWAYSKSGPIGFTQFLWFPFSASWHENAELAMFGGKDNCVNPMFFQLILFHLWGRTESDFKKPQSPVAVFPSVLTYAHVHAHANITRETNLNILCFSKIARCQKKEQARKTEEWPPARMRCAVDHFAISIWFQKMIVTNVLMKNSMWISR